MEIDWIRRFRAYTRSIKLGHGESRENLIAYGKKQGVKFPSDYLDFMESANGANLFFGKMELWEIPVRKDRDIPSWKSMDYMNSETMKAAIPYADKFFLIGRNELGDYIGIPLDETETDEIAYLSPDMDSVWYYHTFQEWLEETWKDWGK